MGVLEGILHGIGSFLHFDAFGALKYLKNKPEFSSIKYISAYKLHITVSKVIQVKLGAIICKDCNQPTDSH